MGLYYVIPPELQTQRRKTRVHGESKNSSGEERLAYIKITDDGFFEAGVTTRTNRYETPERTYGDGEVLVEYSDLAEDAAEYVITGDRDRVHRLAPFVENEEQPSLEKELQHIWDGLCDGDAGQCGGGAPLCADSV